MDHLSSMDASFLHLETPETPMHVGSLMLFDLPEGYRGDYYDDVKAQIAKRLHLARLFRRKLATMPFELADPVWIADDDIDLDYHVRSVTLRQPGTLAQLEVLVARLHSSLLDRSRPLWEVYVIDGLASGQIAFYSKAHHSGVDGKAGIEIAKVFYDLTPQAREVRPPAPARAANAYQLGVAELLQAAVSNSVAQYARLAKMLPQTAKALGGTAMQLVATRRKAPRERSLGLKMAPRTIFNASITNQRSFGSLSVPLPQLKTLGKRMGGTLNDVVMAMCSGALRKFLHERDLLPQRALIALVPVSLREADDSSNNNQVSAIRVDLATDIGDPAKRFHAIRESSEASKDLIGGLKPVLGADLPIAASPWLMSGMASLYGRSNLGARLPRLANVTISNVPGPPAPLYMAGARMEHYYPVSIPYHGVGLNITVQSYAGKMEFGVTACRRLLSQPEVQELTQHLLASLHELQELAAVAEGETIPAATSPAPEPKKRGDEARVQSEATLIDPGGDSRAPRRLTWLGSSQFVRFVPQSARDRPDAGPHAHTIDC
ncbi:wax ester/triacylglycerol synthase family O-acyltransferase [Piscinibacter sp. XHJ-5]|uniref:WS/DGAT/MGAT family O-acyltransferase n=1 Tax=Piscinibacter sp. XHJ-5 TaxID=3037797 RepID=UPI0024530092|nr:wax ester/triacylglycerol synthase family O-acyltransferase [Piscinibacter sp. XHJ-5]